MAAKRKRHHEAHEEHENHERWLITYADMITLLMVLFIVLYSISQVDLAKFRRLKQGVAGGFGGAAPAGALEGGAGALDGGPAALEAELPSLEVVKSAEEALEAQNAFVKAQRQEHQVLEGVREEIQKSLQKDGLGDTVHFRLESRGLVVTVVTDRVLFNIGEANLRPEGREVLDHLAPALRRLPHRISVEGHTDNTPISGRYPSNWELSTARATTVLRELIEREHLPAGRLQAAGYADQRPVAGNDTVEGRAANRRVEIVVLSEVVGPAAAATPAPAADATHAAPAADATHGTPVGEAAHAAPDPTPDAHNEKKGH
jgi:chemotaxis protein MotB